MELHLHSPLGIGLHDVVLNETRKTMLYFYCAYVCAKQITSAVGMKNYGIFPLTSEQFRLTSYPNTYHIALPHHADILACCAYQGNILPGWPLHTQWRKRIQGVPHYAVNVYAWAEVKIYSFLNSAVYRDGSGCSVSRYGSSMLGESPRGETQNRSECDGEEKIPFGCREFNRDS